MTYRFEDSSKKSNELPAGQRGIGCGLMLLLPIVSYMAAIELLKIQAVESFFKRVSPTLFGTPSIPTILRNIAAIRPLVDEIYTWKNLEVNLLFGVVILLILSGLISVIYSIAYRTINPRYGGPNLPPPRHKPTKKAR